MNHTLTIYIKIPEWMASYLNFLEQILNNQRKTYKINTEIIKPLHYLECTVYFKCLLLLCNSKNTKIYLLTTYNVEINKF